MDPETISAYDRASARYATEWREQPAPDDMYALLHRFFSPGPTVDIGCGSGRDVAWLRAQGFDASGYDASEGLLAEARRAYPDAMFGVALLPKLAGVPRAAFQNVLCETVLMHLDPGEVTAATSSLLALLQPGGVLYLSWRVTAGTSKRDDAGRLYAAFDREAVVRAFDAGCTLLFDQESVSASSGKVVHRLLVRRGALSPP